MALKHPKEHVLVDRFNIPITPKDLATLRPPTWLNDEVITLKYLLLDYQFLL